MPKVLLVDDDPSLLAIFETVLKKNGFEVVTAITGAQGLEAAKNSKPDLILLDQIMPDLSGNDVLRKLKEDPSTKSIPTAMLSNFGQNELMDEAMKLGAVDYILKYQVEPEDVVNKVKTLLQENQATVSQ